MLIKLLLVKSFAGSLAVTIIQISVYLIFLLLQDPVPPELMQLLQTSRDVLLMELFPIEEKAHNDTKVQNKAVTVVSKFKVSLH